MPGHKPWIVFWQSSIMLLAVWILGLGWCFYVALHPPDALPPGDLPAVVFQGPWPHSLFRPLALACHPALGRRLFVAEAYTVHELQLDVPEELASEAHLRPSIAVGACLAKHPELVASGLQSLALRCNASRCEAVLLGRDGRQVLRCPLESPDKEPESSLMVAHGGPFSAVAAKESDSSSIWALASAGSWAGSLLHLVPRFRAEAELVPRGHTSPLVERTMVGVARAGKLNLHALSSGGVMALAADGRIFSMGHAPSSGRWLENSLEVGAEGPQRWAGLCDLGAEELFVLGSQGSIWRVPMPAALRSPGL